jgi:hypothetical protein
MYDDDGYDGDECRKCGVRDYGFEMPDVRSTVYQQNCACKNGCKCSDEDKQHNGGECVCHPEFDGCQCEQIRIDVRINRIWDQTCPACDGVDWRPEFQVLQDGKVIATVPTEGAADAVVEALFPDAEAPPRDDAWESERMLRRMEGWGY